MNARLQLIGECIVINACQYRPKCQISILSPHVSPPADANRSFGSASILQDGRVAFNIAGDKHRMVVWTNYPYGVVYGRFIGTHAECDKVDVLVTLVEAYERKNYPLDFPDPVEAIKFEMDQRGLTVKDLEDVIGRANRVYELLTYRRSLTLPMIQRLHGKLGIPAESLIKPSAASERRTGQVQPI